MLLIRKFHLSNEPVHHKKQSLFLSKRRDLVKEINEVSNSNKLEEFEYQISFYTYQLDISYIHTTRKTKKKKRKKENLQIGKSKHL